MRNGRPNALHLEIRGVFFAIAVALLAVAAEAASASKLQPTGR